MAVSFPDAHSALIPDSSIVTSAHLNTKSKPVRKRKASTTNRSQFLRYFVTCDDPTKLRCSLCPDDSPTEIRYVYSGNKKVSTSLRDHLSLHPAQFGEVIKNESRYVQAKRHLIRAIATGALPFSLSNNVELRSFASCLDPYFTLPDAQTLSTTILDDEYGSAYNSVRSCVTQQDVCISFDHWSSKDSAHSLMGACAHFIDEKWQRQLFIISLDPITGAHNGDQVKDYLSDLQSEYNFRSIPCCITDNARVMSAGVSRAALPRLGCALHATHLLVCDSLAAFTEGKDVIDTIRRVAVHIHRSKQSWDLLKEKLNEVGCPDKRKMPLEIKIRWGSMMRMLRVASAQVEHLSDVCEQVKVAPLRFEQRLILARLVAFLVEVDDFCAKMATHEATLSSLIPYLQGLELTIEELRDSALKNYYPHVIAQFRRRLAVYRDNAIVRQFLHMSLLDPNVRAQDLEDIFREADNGFADQANTQPPVKKARSNLLAKAAPRATPREYDLLYELAFMSDVPEDSDPCTFWKAHEQKFPRLANIARRLLSIPPSSIDSERLFSTVGLISSNSRRSRIASATMKKLIFLAAFCRKEHLRFKNQIDYDQFLDELQESVDEEGREEEILDHTP
ncbi:hypothetical protein PRIPAC_89229 [Pristionchus pacificus]|uniref:Dimer_Tnp_hAT domain-containing protein n=1 Tax=Pristionchus pacificus TaxID=54126 RepID=A0A2A6B866_PRIPA|nr:hypothetical protein PRIPAC_89229 [Pristionchus pacificus]|eukprot:PDM62080.1 hypothetical protein PRIPAC_51522 [Pristionchus pacificus]